MTSFPPGAVRVNIPAASSANLGVFVLKQLRHRRRRGRTDLPKAEAAAMRPFQLWSLSNSASVAGGRFRRGPHVSQGLGGSRANVLVLVLEQSGEGRDGRGTDFRQGLGGSVADEHVVILDLLRQGRSGRRAHLPQGRDGLHSYLFVPIFRSRRPLAEGLPPVNGLLGLGLRGRGRLGAEADRNTTDLQQQAEQFHVVPPLFP